MYKLLSHNDLDGVGCGILAKLAFGDKASVRYNSIGGLNREVEWFLDQVDEGKIKDTLLFVTDLSVNEENEKRLDEFFQAGGKLQLIDHHKTALHFNDYEWGRVIVETDEGLTSATSLLYEYLVENKLIEESDAVREFVELVRQYDTWEWEENNNQEAHRLNALFFLLSIDEFEEKMIERLSKSERFFFDDFEQRILDMEDDKIGRYIRRKRRELVQMEVDDYFAGIVFAESYHSELGNELGKDNPHLDYIAIINMGSRRMGFRTIHDDVDVSEVANDFGGGGHAKASGCTLTEEAYQRFVLESFPLEPLREDARRNRYNVKKSSFGTLYRGGEEDIFFVYPENKEEENWAINQNAEKMEDNFDSFEEAEKFLKRKYTAWLVRDDEFVQYLMNRLRQHNN
jgi:uncharacterized protein